MSVLYYQTYSIWFIVNKLYYETEPETIRKLDFTDFLSIIIAVWTMTVAVKCSQE
uniref:Ion transport domain-containing protein n=1 Tax=Amphimedon queenslandica TaxID=400682 RepID=A0A1X7SDI9_AMPQE